MQQKFKDLASNDGTPANPLDYTHFPTSNKQPSSSGRKRRTAKHEASPPVASSSGAFRVIADDVHDLDTGSSEEEALQKSAAAKSSKRDGPTVTHIPVPNPATVTARSVPSCLTCGIQGAAEKITISCHLCKSDWHVACVRRYIPPYVDLMLLEDFAFCCPQCVFPVQGRWDQLMCVPFLLRYMIVSMVH